MNKYAVIDVGSNSVRLMFVANGKVLYKRLNTTRLSEGLATTSLLKEEAIERSANAVATFYQTAKAEGAEKTFVFATAAVRSASNGQAFVARVKTLCGLEVEIISGETEAEIGILGALGNGDGAIIDIGGASTEIIVRKKGELVYKKSVNIGVVRLHDRCGIDETLLRQTAIEEAEKFGVVPVEGEIYAIGGTATTVTALALGLKEYASDKVTGATLSVDEVWKIANMLVKTPVSEIAKMPCVSQGREDVIAGGAILLATVVEKLGIQKIIASDRDNLEGYAIRKGLL